MTATLVRSIAAADIEPSRAAGDVRFLAWVPDERVPADHRAFVQRHVNRAAKLLGLGAIRVRYFGPPIPRPQFWYVPEGPDLIPAGVAPDDQPMTIGILASLRGEAIVHVIAHEVRHVAQHLESGTYFSPRRVVATRLEGDELFVATLPVRDPGGLEHGDDKEHDADAFAARYLEAGR